MKSFLKEKEHGWTEKILLVDWHEDIVKHNGVESVVGAYIKLRYADHSWTAVGVGANSVAASHEALRIGIEYALIIKNNGKL